MGAIDDARRVLSYLDSMRHLDKWEKQVADSLRALLAECERRIDPDDLVALAEDVRPMAMEFFPRQPEWRVSVGVLGRLIGHGATAAEAIAAAKQRQAGS